MYGLSLPHLAILALVVLALFGRGRLSATMGDFGKGIREFRRGMSSGDEPRLTAGQGRDATAGGARNPESPNS